MIQQQVKAERQIECVCETVKAEVLKVNKKVTDLVPFSVYNPKPVHFLHTAAVSSKWVEKAGNI